MVNAVLLRQLLLRVQQYPTIIGPAVQSFGTFNWVSSIPSAGASPAVRPAPSEERSLRQYATSTSAPEHLQPHPKLDASRISKWSQRARANLKYCQERAAWRRQMTALRKQWLAEMQQEADRVRARQSREAKKRALLLTSRDTSKQEQRERQRKERELRDAERAVEVAEHKLQAALRQSLRQNILQEARQRRAEELLEASRTWIPREQVAARIQQALDNPVPL